MEWDPQALVTPMGQLPFFINFLHVSDSFGVWLSQCPLRWIRISPNAPTKRGVLGTVLLSVLSGHKRYAHINGLRGDPGLLEMNKVVSEDSARRPLQQMDEEEGMH